MLLSEMLQRAGLRQSLAVFAEQDSQDRSSRWGGLIIYANGHAQCRLYPPGERHGDVMYLPGEAIQRGAMDCLAAFVGHFGRQRDTVRVQPDASDRQMAATLNTSLLILTGMDTRSFHAGMLTPYGRYLSLGIFSFGPSR